MRRLFALLFAALLLAALPLAAQYRVPPKELADVVDAPPTPNAIPSPDGKWLLLVQQPSMLTIEDLSQTELKLAGIRFNPETHDQTRALYATSLTLAPMAGGTSHPIAGIPAGARMRHPAWSPDASKLAFTVSTPAGVELWVADVAGASARRVGGFVVNQSLGRPFEWMPDSHSLLAAVVPATRSAAPGVPRMPEGPAIQESHGRKTPAPTYEDMLQNESDAVMFEYHMQAVLMHVPLEGGEPSTIVPSSLLLRFSPSPDGRFVLAESAHRPFSYTVPLFRFPQHIAIWSLTGQGAGQRVREIADLPLADQVPTNRDAVRTGPRDAEWRADKPAVIMWAEALDGGDPRKEVPARDRLLTLGEPFTGAPAKLFDVPLRYDSIRWSSDDLALVRSDRWKDRKTQTWRIRPGHPEAAVDLVFDRSSEDRYSDPGAPLSMPNAAGQDVLRLAGDAHSIFLVGGGASPEGARPFLDRFDVDAKKATRLFRSEAPYYEAAVDVLDTKGARFLTRRETATEPANYVLHDGKAAPRALTAFVNPLPELAKASKEVIHYKRADGVDLNATLYLPSGYDAKRDGPLPVVMWAYPAEFKSAAAASQVTTSPYRFTRAPAMGSPIFFVLRGYAVLDNPTIPIVGEGNSEPNDTYVEQLVAGAKAAVDELVRRGVGDRDRMAIAGHSYGAFMTANLLAHSDLFRAGIARSGAYNRTLTPFTFQAEERNYWEASDTYTRMSPFTFANKIHDPLLLIHGEEDDNTGTFPIQSERLYAAISGLGGTVRLVMLPKEAHGYRARETALHVLWEMDQWLGKYVKNAPKRAAGETSKSAP